ncbi:hypothetical protein QBC47DRAFT_374826 [Echria macrotheca]|uniref:Phospholipid-binding protein n=1 Tax=Echria macrotheca TaxID=438768 RepID=A0AAJ0BM82_9PEZI|nr:hypothetical protein QBC47DRAFT_374826 [Echria macrotheca]
MAPPPPSPPSPTLSQLPPVPGSPTYSYASTAANPNLSQYNLPLPPPPTPAHAVLTKADLDHSQTAYADLIASAKSYRIALATLSTAASSFGSALEACARLKEARAEPLSPTPPARGPGVGGGGTLSMTSSFHAAAKASTCTADALLTVAGLQHLVANHQHILSETVYRAFEVPLLHELDKWRGAVEDEEESYARAVAAQSKEIRRLEKEGLKLHRQKRRDVAKFRGHLVELTTKLDGLTALHGDHARTLLRESQDTSVRIVEASCSLVRAEVDIFESLARKGWTGGGLDDVLEKGVDLFASEEPVGIGRGVSSADVNGGIGGGGGGGVSGAAAGGEASKLFSILPPKSILADSGSVDSLGGSGGGGAHNRSDSLLADTDRYQSLAGAVSEHHQNAAAAREQRDTDSVFSEFNRPRPLRPFSPQPQPLRLNPDALLGGVVDVMSPTEEENPATATAISRKQTGEVVEEEEDEVVEGCAIDEEEDDEEAHPWRNEGLIRRRGTETTEKAGASPGIDGREEGDQDRDGDGEVDGEVVVNEVRQVGVEDGSWTSIRGSQ